jgi:3'-5' exoribonuclease
MPAIKVKCIVAKIFITDIEPNQEVETYFVVGEKQLRTARNGTPFLTLKLVDKTGEIVGRVWERAEQTMEQVPVSSLVLIRGRSEKFRDELQLQIQEISPISREQIDPADFLPICPISIEQLFDTLKAQMSTLKRRHFQLLMKAFLADRDLMARFKQAPAAKSVHHAYLGGLLEHTVSVIGLVSRICEHYPDLNRDLLLVGAVWHDVGKVFEFSYDLYIDYSHSGRLLGHMILGLEILQEKLRSLKTFPAEDAMLLKHLILSHHGESQFGAVRLPMTREALALHFADDVDAKMNSVGKILEAGGKSEAWTSYQPLYERFFFRGLPPLAEEGSTIQAADEETGGIQLKIWSKKTERSEAPG